MKPAVDFTRTPEGDVVVLTTAAWRHIAHSHPEMEVHRAEILETVASPHLVLDDARLARRRFYRSGVGPSRWLRVVVDFSGEPAQIVTAFGFRKERPT